MPMNDEIYLIVTGRRMLLFRTSRCCVTVRGRILIPTPPVLSLPPIGADTYSGKMGI